MPHCEMCLGNFKNIYYISYVPSEEKRLRLCKACYEIYGDDKGCKMDLMIKDDLVKDYPPLTPESRKRLRAWYERLR